MFWLLQKIVNLFYLLKIFYWMSFVGMINSYREIKNSNRTQANWTLLVCKFLNIKMKKIPSQYKIRTDKTIFLFDHRSQADFFIHLLLLKGLGNFLARQQVALLFGIVSLFTTNVGWFFNRSGHINLQKFNQWLDKKYIESPSPALAVYPQGHRMYGTKTVSKDKIKRGMIKYAYSRQIPVQFIMTFGNENAFNEKKLKISYGQQITYKIGKTFDPKDFKQANEFTDAVVDQFIRFFDETYLKTQNGSQFEDTTEQLFQALEFKSN